MQLKSGEIECVKRNSYSIKHHSACVNLQATVEVLEDPGEGESVGVSAIYYKHLEDDAVRSTCVLDLG